MRTDGSGARDAAILDSVMAVECPNCGSVRPDSQWQCECEGSRYRPDGKAGSIGCPSLLLWIGLVLVALVLISYRACAGKGFLSFG